MTVDVLLPYYGDVILLKVAVESVRAQTAPDWRLTILDDCSPDQEAQRWGRELEQADPRVRYLRNDANLGANANYRQALQHAEGELLTVMGADDIMLPDHLATVLAAHAAHPDAAIVHPGVQVIDEHGRVVRPRGDRVKSVLRASAVRSGTTAPDGRHVLGGEPLVASLMHGNWLYFPSMAWRTEDVRRHGFRPGLNVVQDLALVLDIVLAGGTMLLDDAVTFRYRRHSASDSSERALRGDRFVEEQDWFSQSAARLQRQGWPHAARAARWHLTSRLNAASLLPRARRSASPAASRTLRRHVTQLPELPQVPGSTS